MENMCSVKALIDLVKHILDCSFTGPLKTLKTRHLLSWAARGGRYGSFGKGSVPLHQIKTSN